MTGCKHFWLIFFSGVPNTRLYCAHCLLTKWVNNETLESFPGDRHLQAKQRGDKSREKQFKQAKFGYEERSPKP